MHNYPPANSYAQKMYNWCDAHLSESRLRPAHPPQACTPTLASYITAPCQYLRRIHRNTLNNKVFKKMGFTLQKEEIDALCNCQNQAVFLRINAAYARSSCSLTRAGFSEQRLLVDWCRLRGC